MTGLVTRRRGTAGAAEGSLQPDLIVQSKSGREPGKQDILDFLSDKIAKWWLPDDVVFVESLAHTATGKLLKTELRARFHGYLAVHG